jgi:hypothetical protein
MSDALKGRIRDLGFGELLHPRIDKLDDRAFGFFSQLCYIKPSENSDWQHEVANHSRSCSPSVWTAFEWEESS